MAAKKYYSIVTLLLIFVLCANLVNVRAAFADGETPTEPPAATDVVTEPAVEATPEPAQSTQAPEAPTAVPVAESAELVTAGSAESVPSAILSAQALENTEIVVLDEHGQALVLGSQDTANALVNSDPVWCPESVSVPTPGANGCSVSYASIAEMLAAMQANPQSFSQNGTIYLERTSGQGFTSPLILDDSSNSLGTSFNTLNLYNLALQGGWNPATGSTSDQTTFSGPTGYVQIGSLTNPWMGSLSINNVSVFGSGAGRDGIQIFASDVTLTNVSASESDRNGISITASNPGTVTLNNVIARNNGHIEGSEPVGSGVTIAGSDTLVHVNGGSFTNNALYGIQALNSTSTTLPTANLWTDKDDYAPGSVVTISGNDNQLNGNTIGFIFGEAVHVTVQGPNGYNTSCEATANSYGGWSCQITLWANDFAIGDYSYSAVGLASGVSQAGTFKDGKPNSVTIVQQSASPTPAGSSATYSITVGFNGNSDPCTADLTITFGGQPTGVSGSFSPTFVSNSAGNQTSTLTISTSSNTNPGQIGFTVTATGRAGCQSPLTALNKGTLEVAAGPTPTNTPVPPTNTPTNTPTNPVVSPTNTPTNTPTGTSAPQTNTPTSTPTNSSVAATNTPTNTPASGSTGTSSSSAPKPPASPTTSTAFIIPLTGGNLLHLNCISVYWAFGIKLTFYNLCEQQASIHSVGANELPSKLPAGFSYLKGLKVEVLTDGQNLEDLPNGSGVEMDFPLNHQSRDKLAVLYWSDPDGDGKSEWIEIKQEFSQQKIFQVLTVTADDELYKLIVGTTSGFYPVLTTDKTGIFVLAKR